VTRNVIIFQYNSTALNIILFSLLFCFNSLHLLRLLTQTTHYTVGLYSKHNQLLLILINYILQATD